MSRASNSPAAAAASRKIHCYSGGAPKDRPQHCRCSASRGGAQPQAFVFTAPTTRPRTRPGSRNRTSAFAGCTLTSTSRGSQVTNNASAGIAARRQIIDIGAARRASEQLVAHRTIIDKEILPVAIGAMPGRQAGKAPKSYALALGIERQRIGTKILTEDLCEPLQQPIGIPLCKPRNRSRKYPAPRAQSAPPDAPSPSAG